MKKAVPFWEKAYQNDDAVAFSAQPNAAVKEIVPLLDKNIKILEVGCGEGNNCFYLARQGFCHIDAFDISENAVTKVKRRCEAENIRFNVFTADLTTYEFDKTYDLILCFGTLHFTLKSAWRQFIRNAQQHTSVGGIHIIQLFTNQVPITEDLAPFAVGLAEDEELKEMYNSWDILQYKSYIFEDEHDHMPKHFHSANKITARKTE